MIKPIDLPYGRPVLVYARWGWEDYTPDDEYQWRVAYLGHPYGWMPEWEDIQEDELRVMSVTSNPYTDYATDILRWKELPDED